MLKHNHRIDNLLELDQPPSGGCVLKLKGHDLLDVGLGYTPAAFRRLCVETMLIAFSSIPHYQPPSGGCVLKPEGMRYYRAPPVSRLQAAVC